MCVSRRVCECGLGATVDTDIMPCVSFEIDKDIFKGQLTVSGAECIKCNEKSHNHSILC